MSNWVRQFHRWVSIAFAVTVIVTSIAMSQKDSVFWIAYLPLPPLGLLLLSGLYLFVLPYAATRGAQRARG